ncbi:GH116 family glycosyl-hydrolase [Formosa undariae]|uniref:GH116 family glycosyl-hydrolase n=1 Tax=Formosa undariae TaxID=1325436 RepID=A0ABV5EZX6_9FLAO
MQLIFKWKEKKAQALLLEGPMSDRYYHGERGAIGRNHGLSRFAEAMFKTAYPFGHVFLKDKDLPVTVIVGAFNPLIPGNVDDSSIPAAILSYKVKNISNKPISISLIIRPLQINEEAKKLHQGLMTLRDVTLVLN